MDGDPLALRAPKVKFEALLLGPPGWPFAKYEVPAPKVVTEDFRLWSPCDGAPLMPLLLTMVGGPIVGTAGWIGV